MAECATTNMGGKFFICATTQNAELDESGYDGLTWLPVPNMGTHGDTGVEQGISTYSTWDNETACKSKGEASALDPTVEFADKPSAGMTALLAGAAPTNRNNYATKIEWDDGSIEYNRGLIAGYQRMKGQNEDFKRISFTFGYQEVPLIVDAA